MAATQREPTTAGHSADVAMGIELMVIEVEYQLEWAEAQGRTKDADDLTARLVELHTSPADIADHIPLAAEWLVLDR